MAGDGTGRVGGGVELEVLRRVGGLGGLGVELGHGRPVGGREQRCGSGAGAGCWVAID